MQKQQSLTKIINATNISSIQDFIHNTNQNDLVMFDVDYVLIAPVDEYNLYGHSYRQKLWSNLKSRVSQKQLNYFHSIVTLSSPRRLVEQEVLNILNMLEHKSIPTMALTAAGTGEFGIIKDREEFRTQELLEVGINFKELTPIKQEITLPELQDEYGIPMLKHGIISTAELNKALVLEQILDKANYYPQNIIFIDDFLHNLQAVEELCQKLNIRFTGVHYTAESLKNEPEINQALEDLRFEILETDHSWLGYNELTEILSSINGKLTI